MNGASGTTPRTRPLWLLGLFLIAASLSPVQKYAGTAGVVFYSAIVMAIAVLAVPRLADWMAAHVSERRALWLAAITLVLLGAIFAVVYPIADAGVVGGGSDREDNLTAATAELLHGRYPYYVRSYLGLPPDILPGTMLLAAPFVLLGDSAYQNFFWLAAYIVAARWLLRDGRQALLMLWALLALSPAVLLELVTGGELIANSLFVLLFALLLVRSVSRVAGKPWQSLAFAILLGIGLSSRANFLLVLPLVFSAIVQNAGWKNAFLYTGIACITFGLVTVPFYLIDPAGFEPARLQNRFEGFEALLPQAGLILPAAVAGVAAGLCFRRVDNAGVTFLENCAIVQFLPIAAGHLLTMAQAGNLRWTFGVEGWGLFFLFFGVLAAWARAFGPGQGLAHTSLLNKSLS